MRKYLEVKKKSTSMIRKLIIYILCSSGKRRRCINYKTPCKYWSATNMWIAFQIIKQWSWWKIGSLWRILMIRNLTNTTIYTVTILINKSWVISFMSSLLLVYQQEVLLIQDQNCWFHLQHCPYNSKEGKTQSFHQRRIKEWLK